jgi:hypothetical protein
MIVVVVVAAAAAAAAAPHSCHHHRHHRGAAPSWPPARPPGSYNRAHSSRNKIDGCTLRSASFVPFAERASGSGEPSRAQRPRPIPEIVFSSSASSGQRRASDNNCTPPERCQCQAGEAAAGPGRECNWIPIISRRAGECRREKRPPAFRRPELFGANVAWRLRPPANTKPARWPAPRCPHSGGLVVVVVGRRTSVRGRRAQTMLRIDPRRSRPIN